MDNPYIIIYHRFGLIIVLLTTLQLTEHDVDVGKLKCYLRQIREIFGLWPTMEADASVKADSCENNCDLFPSTILYHNYNPQ